MEKELISVIIPVYKVEQYLVEAVDSVRNQTYKNLEIILVDDGSPDSCGAMCDEIAKQDNRIKVIHQVNGGLSNARNTGLKIATGDYIGFLDSDDYADLDMFEMLHSMVKKYDCDISMVTYYRNEDRSDATVSNEFLVYNSEEALKQILLDQDIQNHVYDKLYKRKVFEGNFFLDGYNYEDIDIMPRLIEKANKIVFNNTSKYYYRKRSDSILGTVTKKSRYMYAEVSNNKDLRLMEIHPDLKPYCQYSIVKTIANVFYDVSVLDFDDVFYSDDFNKWYQLFVEIVDEAEVDLIRFFRSVRKMHMYYLYYNKEEYKKIAKQLPSVYKLDRDYVEVK